LLWFSPFCCRSPFVCHSRRESAFIPLPCSGSRPFVVVPLLFVIPEGNLLLSLCLALVLALLLSFPFRLSFPKGICFCPFAVILGAAQE
jgi:hypothetical protein